MRQDKVLAALRRHLLEVKTLRACHERECIACHKVKAGAPVLSGCEAGYDIMREQHHTEQRIARRVQADQSAAACQRALF